MHCQEKRGFATRFLRSARGLRRVESRSSHQGIDRNGGTLDPIIGELGKLSLIATAIRWGQLISRLRIVQRFTSRQTPMAAGAGKLALPFTHHSWLSQNPLVATTVSVWKSKTDIHSKNNESFGRTHLTCVRPLIKKAK